MRWLLIIALLLNLMMLVISASACATSGNTTINTNVSSVGTNTPSTSIPPVLEKENTAQIQQNDILLKLSANKSTYVPGEIVLVTASVENLSGNSIEYALSSIGVPIPLVWLENNPYFSVFALEEKELGGVRTVLPMPTTGQLKASSQVTRNVVWDQKILFKNQQAPQGTYMISCGITLGNYQNRDSLTKISTNISIHLIGAPAWMTPEHAKEIALNIPDIKSWREAHSGKNVVKEENGGIFVYLNDEWMKVSPQFAISESSKTISLDELKEWMPELYVNLENGKWAVRMGTKLGPNPHFVKIQIDTVKSSVIEIQFSDRGPL